MYVCKKEKKPTCTISRVFSVKSNMYNQPTTSVYAQQQPTMQPTTSPYAQQQLGQTSNGSYGQMTNASTSTQYPMTSTIQQPYYPVTNTYSTSQQPYYQYTTQPQATNASASGQYPQYQYQYASQPQTTSSGQYPQYQYTSQPTYSSNGQAQSANYYPTTQQSMTTAGLTPVSATATTVPVTGPPTYHLYSYYYTPLGTSSITGTVQSCEQQCTNNGSSCVGFTRSSTVSDSANAACYLKSSWSGTEQTTSSKYPYHTYIKIPGQPITMTSTTSSNTSQ